MVRLGEENRLREASNFWRFPNKDNDWTLIIYLETTIGQFVEAKVVTGNACPQQQQAPSQQEVPIRVVLPYKDQKAANSVRRQLSDLSRKINTEIGPVYTSRKIKDTIKVKEQKPPIVNQQSAVYYFTSKCDLCDALIMSAIRVGTYTSASKNTKDRLSDVTLKNNMERSQIVSRRILRF